MFTGRFLEGVLPNKTVYALGEKVYLNAKAQVTYDAGSFNWQELTLVDIWQIIVKATDRDGRVLAEKSWLNTRAPTTRVDTWEKRDIQLEFQMLASADYVKVELWARRLILSEPQTFCADTVVALQLAGAPVIPTTPVVDVPSVGNLIVPNKLYGYEGWLVNATGQRLTYAQASPIVAAHYGPNFIGPSGSAITQAEWQAIIFSRTAPLALADFQAGGNGAGTGTPSPFPEPPVTPDPVSYTCPYGDGFQFSTYAALQAHIASAHASSNTPTLYTCPYGDGQQFSSSAALQAHIQAAHAGGGSSGTPAPAFDLGKYGPYLAVGAIGLLVLLMPGGKK